MIKINYPGSGNNSQFTIDGMGHWGRIIENTAGSVVSTKQFIWELTKATPLEARDGSSVITSQYFQHGQTLAGKTTKYFYSRDHLNSIRELTDSSGTVQALYAYDAFGRKERIAGTIDSDFQFAGYYFHSASILNLTLTRSYAANLGRWIARDSIFEEGGINLYAYVNNRPSQFRDPSGQLDPFQHYCRWWAEHQMYPNDPRHNTLPPIPPGWPGNNAPPTPDPPTPHSPYLQTPPGGWTYWA
jgi:RHS repeat-associated protein